jgi:HEAT repeat protein
LIAACHDVIIGAVPQIVHLLKDNSLDVQSAGADAIGKLAKHCK